MSKFNTFLADHGTKVIIALLVLTYFKSCSIDSDVDKIKKDQRSLVAEVDSLQSQLNRTIITEDLMIKLIK